MSPGFTTWRGSLTNVVDMAEIWTRPSWWTPTSTNAPKVATLVTTPSRTIPGVRSSNLSTPSLKVAALKAGRGSRPGFSSSLSMSVTVGRPKVSSTNSLAWSERSTLVLPMRVVRPHLVFSRMRRTTG